MGAGASASQVREHVEGLGNAYQPYGTTLEDNGVDGALVEELAHDDRAGVNATFDDLGITNKLHRRKLLQAARAQHGVQPDAAGQRIVVPPPRGLMMLRVSAGSIVRAPRVRTRAGLLPLLIVLRPGLHDRPRDALFPPPTGLPSCGLSPHLILEMPKFATSKSSVFARSKKPNHNQHHLRS